MRGRSMAGNRKQKARRVSRRARSLRCRSDGLQIGSRRLAAPPVGFNVEADLLAFDQAAHSGALDGRDVNEHVRAASLLLNEAEAFLGVEKLYRTCCHSGILDTHKCVGSHDHSCAPISAYVVFFGTTLV